MAVAAVAAHPAVAVADAAEAAAEAAAAVAEAVAEAVVSAEAAVAAAAVSAADADEDAVERVDVVRRSIARGGMKRPTRLERGGRESPRRVYATPPSIRRRLRRRRVDGRGATASTRWFQKLCNDQHMSFHAATMRDGEDARISVLESATERRISILFRFPRLTVAVPRLARSGRTSRRRARSRNTG